MSTHLCVNKINLDNMSMYTNKITIAASICIDKNSINMPVFNGISDLME